MHTELGNRPSHTHPAAVPQSLNTPWSRIKEAPAVAQLSRAVISKLHSQAGTPGVSELLNEKISNDILFERQLAYAHGFPPETMHSCGGASECIFETPEVSVVLHRDQVVVTPGDTRMDIPLGTSSSVDISCSLATGGWGRITRSALEHSWSFRGGAWEVRDLSGI